MATSKKRAQDIMGTREGHGERADQSVTLPAKTKNSAAPRLSPYAKRSASQGQERKTSTNTNLRAVSNASKAKNIPRSPSYKPTCTSAPATTVRVPGERQIATNPSLKAKQGVCNMNLGVPRERWSAPLTQPHLQRQATYMMVPVRLKKAGLKLLDPEKVKNLASLAAATTFESGEERLHSHLHQAYASKQRSLNFRHRAVVRFPAKQMSPSRKRTGIPGRWPDINQSIKESETSGDHESHLLTQQIDGLVLSEKDGSKSSSCKTGQEAYNPQMLPHPITNQKLSSKPDQTAWTDDSSIEETNNSDLLEIQTVQTRSIRKEEIILDIVNKEVKEEDLDFRTKNSAVVQGQRLEEGKDSELQLSSKENHETEGVQLEVESDDRTQTQADALSNPQGDTCTESQSQEDTISSHDPLEKSPRANEIDSTNKRCASFPSEEDPSEQKISMGFVQSSSSAKENIDDMGAGVCNSEEDIKSYFSSRGNDIIRRSQGVLVLARSTDENAIFIPKLKFEFTPDNSIDWNALHPSMTKHHGNQNREKDPMITKPCTPRGPSFSKSVLKKSSAFQGYIPTAGGNSESTPGSIGAERSTKDSCLPFHGIVDLSISFQGKYVRDEIPKDIPKISLMEGDSDED